VARMWRRAWRREAARGRGREGGHGGGLEARAAVCRVRCGRA
jgi:hypothetical protein